MVHIGTLRARDDRLTVGQFVSYRHRDRLNVREVEYPRVQFPQYCEADRAATATPLQFGGAIYIPGADQGDVGSWLHVNFRVPLLGR